MTHEEAVRVYTSSLHTQLCAELYFLGIVEENDWCVNVCPIKNYIWDQSDYDV